MMMTTFESVMSVVMLGGFIWALRFLLPRAWREHDAFGVICSLLIALVGLIGFLFLGVRIRSR